MAAGLAATLLLAACAPGVSPSPSHMQSASSEPSLVETPFGTILPSEVESSAPSPTTAPSGTTYTVRGGDTLSVRKPDGGHVSWVMEQLGATADRAVMVGDNHNDIEAARGAGIPVIAVSYGYPHFPTAEMGADAIIDHFTELPEMLDTLAKR